MAGSDFPYEATELMVVVERLSSQDQGRILYLIDLLFRSSRSQRENAQRMLRELVAREPETHVRCLALIDAIIENVEGQLEGEQGAEWQLDAEPIVRPEASV